MMNLLYPFLPPLLLTLLMIFVKTHTQHQVFSIVLKNLSEKNNILPQHVFAPSAIQAFLQKESFVDLPSFEQLRTIENNPHHWLTTCILRVHPFQYHFFQNLTLNTQTRE